MNPLEFMLILYSALTAILLLLLVKNQVLKRLYGEKYQRVTFLDTGWVGWKKFSKDSTCRHEGREYVFNRNKMKANILYYLTSEAEPLELERNENKYEYYSDSDEFTSLIKNKILRVLMLVQAQDFIVVILVLCAACVVFDVLLWFKVTDIAEMVQTAQNVPAEVIVK